MFSKYSLYILFFIGIILSACEKETEGSLYYQAPSHFPKPVYSIAYNQAKFNLGKKLFFDPILSRDNSISCGSCHQQFAAFAHLNHTVSHGIDNRLGTRNAPGLFNLAWNKSFMWDGGINHIEVMSIAPITNPVEMDEKLISVVQKLNNSTQYKKLFTDAFGASTITSQHMLVALANFMAAMVSANSRYDQYVLGDETALNADEKEGLQLFNTHCASCHAGPLFTDQSFKNNGLDSDFTHDTGRHHITLDANDMGKFKVPSLRNVALTAPYMHDGRFNTLNDVLNHYTNGIKQSATLDASLGYGLTITADEKAKIIAFLNTLTDKEFTNNPAFK